MASTARQKEVRTKWPVTEGNTAGTTKLRKKHTLKASKGALWPKLRKGVGL
jgi:hypothetical protein